ncbi:MAG: hypothetical protein VX785_12070, partial [Actinomycetota bacterium]|nr:hypothetical protein [Actinomycetota bacterium]
MSSDSVIERVFDCLALRSLSPESMVRLRRLGVPVAVCAGSPFLLPLEFVAGFAGVSAILDGGFLSAVEVRCFLDAPVLFVLSLRPRLLVPLGFLVLSGRRQSRFAGGVIGRTRARTWARFPRNPSTDDFGSVT